MKKPLYAIATICSVIAALYSCSKGGNNYTTTDHTKGMTTNRTWEGTAYGYIKGDTVKLPDTSHIDWPKSFSRTISDTNFTMTEVNGFAIKALGTTFSWQSTDSPITKTTIFDTILSPGAAASIATYFFSRDSISFEIHVVSGYNSATGIYYQSNEFFHTK